MRKLIPLTLTALLAIGCARSNLKQQNEPLPLGEVGDYQWSTLYSAEPPKKESFSLSVNDSLYFNLKRKTEIKRISLQGNVEKVIFDTVRTSPTRIIEGHIRIPSNYTNLELFIEYVDNTSERISIKR
mgnify:CR=1 FL=1